MDNPPALAASIFTGGGLLWLNVTLKSGYAQDAGQAHFQAGLAGLNPYIIIAKIKYIKGWYMKLKLIFLGALCLSVFIMVSGCSSSSVTVTSPAAYQSSASATPVTAIPPLTAAVASTTTAPVTSITPVAPVTTTSIPASAKQWSQPPAMQIDASKKYVATMETSSGSFKIELYGIESPKTVNNFVFLSREGYYNGVIFHRIIKEFMIQSGDPKGTGMGGPGYKFADELPPKHLYEPGIVAMANAGPNTNGSQFFICTGATSGNLNKMPNYTQFGKVIEGMDVVMKIASVQTVAGPSGEVSKPVNPPVIIAITITES
jgi:cyclophilin family peptidyl-prolyl cis-trans isomerase